MSKNEARPDKLPPLWWISRRLRLVETTTGWRAEYYWLRSGWAVDSDVSGLDAKYSLLGWLRDVKDGRP